MRPVAFVAAAIRLSVLLGVWLIAEGAWSDDSKLSGIVIDAMQNPLPGVDVTIEMSGKRISTITGADGKYVFDPATQFTPAQLDTIGLIIEFRKKGYRTEKRVVRAEQRGKFHLEQTATELARLEDDEPSPPGSCDDALTFSPVPMCGIWTTDNSSATESEYRIDDIVYAARPYRIRGFVIGARTHGSMRDQYYLGSVLLDTGAQISASFSIREVVQRSANDKRERAFVITLPPVPLPTRTVRELFEVANQDEVSHYAGYYDAERQIFVIEDKIILKDSRRGSSQRVSGITPDVAYRRK